MESASAIAEKPGRSEQELVVRRVLHVMRNAMMPISSFLHQCDNKLTDPALREVLGAAQTAYQKMRQALTQLP